MTEKPARVHRSASDRTIKARLVRLLIKLEKIARHLEEVSKLSEPATK